MNKIKGYEGEICCWECEHVDDDTQDAAEFIMFCEKHKAQVLAWGKCPDFCPWYKD